MLVDLGAEGRSARELPVRRWPRAVGAVSFCLVLASCSLNGGANVSDAPTSSDDAVAQSDPASTTGDARSVTAAVGDGTHETYQDDHESSPGDVAAGSDAAAESSSVDADNEADADGSSSRSEEQEEDSEGPELVGKAASMSASRSPHVVMPDGMQQGDLLLLFVSTNVDDIQTGPSGVGSWESEARIVSGQLAVSVYSRVATGMESGLEVSITQPAMRKTDMTVLAYRGTSDDPVEALESAVVRNTASHTTPEVFVDEPNWTVVSFWADRSSSTSEWSAPSGVTVLSSQVGVGGGRVSTLVAEDQPGTGAYGGLVAQTNDASARGVAFTIVLAP